MTNNVVAFSLETPEQLLLQIAGGVAEYIDEVESVAVIKYMKDGSLEVSHNTMPNERLLYLGMALQTYAVTG